MKPHIRSKANAPPHPRRATNGRLWPWLACLAVAGCGGGDSTGGPHHDTRADAGQDANADGDSQNGALPGEPSTRSEVPFDEPVRVAGRKRTRLSAEQLRASLETATGEPWLSYELYAESIGRPDYFEVTDENLEPSVPMARLFEQGAREACTQAVLRDVSTDPAQMRPAGEPNVILRHATALDTLDGARERIVQNLQYLLLRFHGTKVTEADDPRLTPWLQFAEGLEPGLQAAVGNAVRWGYLCIALSTHPDFVTY